MSSYLNTANRQTGELNSDIMTPDARSSNASKGIIQVFNMKALNSYAGNVDSADLS